MKLKIYGHLLFFLLFLFCLRVIGQFVQTYYPVAFLPDLDQWQGSNIPYIWLLSFQIFIIFLSAIVAFRFVQSSIIPHRKMGSILLVLGLIYFAIMFIRLLLGLTLLTDNEWFAKAIPAFFHLVLASMVLLVGHYHWSQGLKSE